MKVTELKLFGYACKYTSNLYGQETKLQLFGTTNIHNSIYSLHFIHSTTTFYKIAFQSQGAGLFCWHIQRETVLCLFQMTRPAASSPAPSPRVLCPPTLRPVTPPPAATCRSAPAAWGLPLSSTPQGRSMASPCRPSGSTWATAMSTRCITWCRWVSQQDLKQVSA